MLYLGDIFERPEVRDMLALLELASEPDGRGLVRVARFTEYGIPLADVRALRQLASDKSVPFPRALRLTASVESISEAGERGLAQLERHLDGLSYGTQPWALLVHYLFARSHYLQEVLADMSVLGQQRRLALYQFLQFVHDQRPAPGGDDLDDPKRRLLRYVRQLEIFGEEKQLRQVPSWAESIDAVRLLTVHASKGLEFRAVYLPVLGQGYFPARKQAQPCPPPKGMLEVVRDDHAEEEECLFFVALSRARDTLCLSRAVRYGKQNSSPSSLLRMLEEALPQPLGGGPTWHAATPPHLPAPDPSRVPLAFNVRQLDVYLRCPRQFYYEFVLGLSGKREDSAYVQFHLCVYQVLQWMHEERAAGHEPEESAALAKLAEVWQARGPHDHPYEAMYRQSAENMVMHWAGRPMRRRSIAIQAEWAVDLPHGRVTLVPDHLEQLEDGSEIVERLRTGRPTKSELDKDIYGLYVVAAREAQPRVPRTVQIRYLSDDVIQPVELKERAVRARLDRYDGAIAGILREEFPPEPNERNCPRCPHYFICPLAEDR